MSPAINAQISKYPMPFFLQYWQPLFATYNVYNTMKSGFACYKNYNTKESRNYNTNCIKLLIAPSFILLHPFLTFFFSKITLTRNWNLEWGRLIEGTLGLFCKKNLKKVRVGGVFSNFLLNNEKEIHHPIQYINILFWGLLLLWSMVMFYYQ